MTSACGAELREASGKSVIGNGSGLSPEAVHQVVRAHVPAIRACYERFAKAENRPQGVVRFGWHVEPSGAVTNVELVASTLHSAAIESCIKEDIPRWQFPGSALASEIAEYPFTF